jgi:hypothetical protein
MRICIHSEVPDRFVPVTMITRARLRQLQCKDTGMGALAPAGALPDG